MKKKKTKKERKKKRFRKRVFFVFDCLFFSESVERSTLSSALAREVFRPLRHPPPKPSIDTSPREESRTGAHAIARSVEARRGCEAFLPRFAKSSEISRPVDRERPPWKSASDTFLTRTSLLRETTNLRKEESVARGCVSSRKKRKERKGRRERKERKTASQSFLSSRRLGIETTNNAPKSRFVSAAIEPLENVE